MRGGNRGRGRDRDRDRGRKRPRQELSTDTGREDRDEDQGENQVEEREKGIRTDQDLKKHLWRLDSCLYGAYKQLSGKRNWRES